MGVAPHFGTRVVLISPEGESEPLLFKLEFGNTNNMEKYEALLLRITFTKERGIELLKAQGDAKLVVHQVKGKYSVKYHRLKNYRNRVWDEIEELDAFSITSVPR